jgi:hypothetical protein
MFLHIKTFDNQISVHAKDLVPAIAAVEEVKDKEGNVTQPAVPAVPSKPAEPLRNAIREALDYFNRIETDIVTFHYNKKLDLNKTAKENELAENDFITVTSQAILDKKEAEKV